MEIWHSIKHVADLVAVSLKSCSMEIQQDRKSSRLGHFAQSFRRRGSKDGIRDNTARVEKGQFVRLVYR